MRSFFCNHYVLITTFFILNSMTVHTERNRKQEAIIDNKRSISSDMEDLEKTVKLYNKLMEDPSYYESYSRVGQGRNASAQADNLRNKTESTTTEKQLPSEINVAATVKTFTPTKLTYEYLLEELNRKIKNLSMPIVSLTTVKAETASPGAGKIQNVTITENSIPNVNRGQPTTPRRNFLLNPVPFLKRTTARASLAPNISGLLENQKNIIKQLLVNIDIAQRVLTYASTTDSVESTTELKMKDENEVLLTTSKNGAINDISAILLKLAEVESNASTNNDKKQKSKNPFSAFLQKILKTKNFADVPQF